MHFSTPKLAGTFYAQLFRAKGLYNNASPEDLARYPAELMEAFSSVRIVWGDGQPTTPGTERPKRGTALAFRLVSDIRQGKPEYVEALKALEARNTGEASQPSYKAKVKQNIRTSLDDPSY